MNNNTDNPHLIDDLVSAIEKAITGYKEASKQTTIQILSESRLSELSQSITKFIDNKEPIPNEIYHEWMQLVIMPKEKKEHPVQVPVLFTSFDNVEIKEGDKCFYINNNKEMPITKWFAEKYQDEKSYNHHVIKYFSTQEAAQAFVIMNKPCLSVNDCKEVMGEYKFWNPIQKLTELSKSKNNQQ